MNREDFKIEVCANGVESCLAAQDGGADRVELCAGIPEGGTTPSYGEMLVARDMLKTTRLHVIVRPRGGDFLYTPLEVRRMAADIDMARRIGADGVVFGCLTPQGRLDKEANLLLMEHAKGMSVTFHRAFDRCQDPAAIMEELIIMGFDRILTSGQQPTADKGVRLLKQLNEQARGRIAILAGSGVNESNIAHIHRETGLHEFHFSARTTRPGGMLFTNPDIYMGRPGAEENLLKYTSADRVRKTIANLLND